MKKKFLFIIIFYISFNIYGQQEPIFSQYYLNDMFINPAVSGSKISNPLTILTRQQWLGFEGAPFTTNISYHGALNNRSAMGGYLMFDKLYPSLQTNLHLNYAYHIPLDYNKINLSFGLGGKIMYYNLDFNLEDLPPGNDNAFSANTYEKILADASSGVYLYARNFYAGFSTSNLFRSSFNDPVKGSPFGNEESRNFYFTGAYRFKIVNNDWELEPSFLSKKVERFPAIYDLTTRIIFLRDTWGGITYRTDGTAIFLLGFTSHDIHFSYAYDYTLKDDIHKYSYGTHEIGISFYIKTLATQRHIGFWEY